MAPVPSWLGPWWHEDFEVHTDLSLDAVRGALTERASRLRCRVSPDGMLTLSRRGGFMNGFAQAQARLTANGSRTTATVRLARPREAAIFFAIALVVLFVGPVVNVIEVGLTHGLSAGASWLPFVLIGPGIWAVVIGMNYTSARSEAKDLRRLISQALSRTDRFDTLSGLLMSRSFTNPPTRFSLEQAALTPDIVSRR